MKGKSNKIEALIFLRSQSVRKENGEIYGNAKSKQHNKRKKNRSGNFDIFRHDGDDNQCCENDS